MGALSSPSLYQENVPARFWRLLQEPAPTAGEWMAAVRAAAAQLPDAARSPNADIESLLDRTLGEGQFGPSHWRLGLLTRLYYALKPVLPRPLTGSLRRLHRGRARGSFPLDWPIETRFAAFQWEIVRQLLRRTEQAAFRFIDFWPEGRPYALVLTHDVETADGQAYVRAVADLDAGYGFRSSFNFVPERYRVDRRLIDELRDRGFEIGVHGLNHDGTLFRSYPEFIRRAGRINRYLKEFGAVGFRAPLMHRHPGWMQALEIEYDLSFFDTDPFEPIPGGTMSLWPFVMGRFVELPYTLVQDYTLTAVLQETTPRLWLDKVDVLRSYSGMALLNSHPDYLRNPRTLTVYEAFLRAMRSRADYWHALPHEVARWWRARMNASSTAELPGAVERTIRDSDAPAPLTALAS